METEIQRGLEASCEVIQRLMAPHHTRELEIMVQLWLHALRTGHKILFIGNGGSAADAQHLAAELVGRFAYDRPALPAIALTTDTSALTAIGNDYGFDQVFSRQVEALGARGDLLVAISTSGYSMNVLKALQVAKTRGMITMGLSGNTGGEMHPFCDALLKVPSACTAHVQQCHLMIGHLLCELVEKRLYPLKKNENVSTQDRQDEQVTLV